MLQHAATCCNTLDQRSRESLRYAATHCNTLQHVATRCNTLQHTWLEERETHWIGRGVRALLRDACNAHCNTLQHAATQCSTLQHTATHCNTLQRTAAHCNTLQHTAADTLHHAATHTYERPAQNTFRKWDCYHQNPRPWSPDEAWQPCQKRQGLFCQKRPMHVQKGQGKRPTTHRLMRRGKWVKGDLYMSKEASDCKRMPIKRDPQ